MYPIAEDSVRNLAYSFSYAYSDCRAPETYTRTLGRRIASWQCSGSASALFFVDLGGALLVIDLRPRAPQPLTVLAGLDRTIYLAADSVADVTALAGSQRGSPKDIGRRLDRLVHRGLMLRDGDRCLALAIAAGEYQPGPEARASFRRAIRRIGKRVRGGTCIRLSCRLPVEDGGGRVRKRASVERIDS